MDSRLNFIEKLCPQYLSDIQALSNSSLVDEDHGYIPSIRHRSKVADVTKSLQEKYNLSHISLCLNFDDRNKFVLSNDPGGIVKPYYRAELYRLDSFFSLDKHEGKDYFFPELCADTPIDKGFIGLIQHFFKIYSPYVIVRYFEECTLFVAFGTDKAQKDLTDFYKSTIHSLEDFVVEYLDETSHVFKEQNDCFGSMRLFENKKYRRDVIRGQLSYKLPTGPIKLSQRQTQCLFWANKSKTNAEIAMILGLETEQVKDAIKEARKKLNAVDKADATRRALKLGLIV